jgi:hypothetical protein
MRWPSYRRAAGLEPAPRAGQRMIRREWECPSLEGADQTEGFADSSTVWLVAQNVVSIILFFFVGLALRNYFKIR